MKLEALLLDNYNLKLVEHAAIIKLEDNMVSRVGETEESWQLYDMLQRFLKTSNPKERTLTIRVVLCASKNHMEINIEANVIYALMRLLGDDVKVQVEISDTCVEIPNPLDGGDVFRSKEIVPKFTQSQQNEVVLTYKDKIQGFPIRWQSYWKHRQVACLGKLKLRISGNFVLAGKSQCHFLPHHQSLTAVQRLEQIQKMMNGEIDMDTVLVTADGTELPCHSKVLIAHSPVLKTELEGEFVEAQTKRIKLPVLSTEAVRELLACLYYWDVERATLDFSVAMELLECAHMYAIEKLENDVKLFIVRKAPTEGWMNLSEAIRLFFFARNVSNLTDVEKWVLMFMKGNPRKLLSSPEYNDLLQTEPESFKILSDALLLFSI